MPEHFWTPEGGLVSTTTTHSGGRRNRQQQQPQQEQDVSQETDEPVFVKEYVFINMTGRVTNWSPPQAVATAPQTRDGVKPVRQKQKPEQPPLMMVPSSTMALLTGQQYRGKYYAFLMTHSLSGKKTHTGVGYTTNPIHELVLHNTMRANDRTTNAAAPHWVLDVALGVFSCAQKARQCCEQWVNGSRGKENKRRKAPLLSEENQVDMYTSELPPTKPLAEELKRVAPAMYYQCYMHLLLEQQQQRVK
jgi:hypothetical protein